MKACPYSKHTSADNKLDFSPPDVNMREHYGELGFQVTCICGMRGPYAKSYEKAEALWDAMPRQEAADKLRDALGKIVIWADAYPPDVFPPYNDFELAELNVLLESRGYSLSALGAQMMWRVVEGVGEIARQALEVSDDNN